MHLSVKNAKNPTLIKWLKTAGKFYAEELMHPNLIRRLSVKIEISDTLKTLGMCDWCDDYDRRPREFHIILKRQKRAALLFKSLAHEFVHVKQYASGEMDGLIRGHSGSSELELTKWAGGQVKFASLKRPILVGKNKILIHDKGYDYYYHPWEIEAYGLEIGLYHYFINTYGKSYKEFRKQYGSIS